jgi:hypothetical protein
VHEADIGDRDVELVGAVEEVFPDLSADGLAGFEELICVI